MEALIHPLALVATPLWAGLAYGLAAFVARARGLNLKAPAYIAVPGLIGVGMLAYSFSAAPRALAIDMMVIGVAMAVWTDARWMVMFDLTTYATLAATLVALFPVYALPHGIESTILGMVAAAGMLGAVAILTRGAAMGLGDVKLALSIGAAFGLEHVAAFLVSLAAMMVVIGGLLLLRGRRGEIAFGPFLAAGVATTVGFGPFILRFLGAL